MRSRRCRRIRHHHRYFRQSTARVHQDVARRHPREGSSCPIVRNCCSPSNSRAPVSIPRRGDAMIRAPRICSPRGTGSDLVGSADKAGVDFAFLPDDFGVTSAENTVRGRLEAVAVAARLSTATSRDRTDPHRDRHPYRTVPRVQGDRRRSTTPHSAGRDGRSRCPRAGTQARLFGRKEAQHDGSLWAEAHEAVEVASRLWDSWEDDAEIRDVETGRFIDRDKLHYIDFEGEYFSVKGPSITPRSPQGAAARRGHDHRRALLRLRRCASRSRTDSRGGPASGGRSRRPRARRRGRPSRPHPSRRGSAARRERGRRCGRPRSARALDRCGIPPGTVFHRGTSAGFVDLLELVHGWTASFSGLSHWCPPCITSSTTCCPCLRPTVEPAAGTLRDRLGLDPTRQSFATAH